MTKIISFYVQWLSNNKLLLITRAADSELDSNQLPKTNMNTRVIIIVTVNRDGVNTRFKRHICTESIPPLPAST